LINIAPDMPSLLLGNTTLELTYFARGEHLCYGQIPQSLYKVMDDIIAMVTLQFYLGAGVKTLVFSKEIPDFIAWKG